MNIFFLSFVFWEIRVSLTKLLLVMFREIRRWRKNYFINNFGFSHIRSGNKGSDLLQVHSV